MLNNIFLLIGVLLSYIFLRLDCYRTPFSLIIMPKIPVVGFLVTN